MRIRACYSKPAHWNITRSSLERRHDMRHWMDVKRYVTRVTRYWMDVTRYVTPGYAIRDLQGHRTVCIKCKCHLLQCVLSDSIFGNVVIFHVHHMSTKIPPHVCCVCKCVWCQSFYVLPEVCSVCYVWLCSSSLLPTQVQLD